MWRYVLFGAVLVALATQAPSFMQSRINENHATKSPPPDLPLAASAEVEPGQHNPLAGRVARIDADRRGHFVASARLNGRSMNVLVDTGATLVAINESTARRIGIHLSPGDFKYRVRTANGLADAAEARIDEIEIGRVVVRNVPATVARDSSLSGTLLGMSFLNRLKKFEVDSGTLVLTQ